MMPHRPIMIRIPVGQGYIPNVVYIGYMIWLVKHDLIEAWHFYPESKANVVEFEDEEDAIAFKLRFGL